MEVSVVARMASRQIYSFIFFLFLRINGYICQTSFQKSVLYRQQRQAIKQQVKAEKMVEKIKLKSCRFNLSYLTSIIMKNCLAQSINIPSENADIQFILGLFDKEELGLTITEDNEENQRSSTAFLKMTESKYKAAFTSYFRSNRKEGISFVDAAIRFMNSLKKMKIEELLVYVSQPKSYNHLLENFITPELLVDPIEEELMFGKLSQKDKNLYQEALKLLTSQKELGVETKQKIRGLLEQVESN